LLIFADHWFAENAAEKAGLREKLETPPSSRRRKNQHGGGIFVILHGPPQVGSRSVKDEFTRFFLRVKSRVTSYDKFKMPTERYLPFELVCLLRGLFNAFLRSKVGKRHSSL
jgi:hypothetical protein